MNENYNHLDKLDTNEFIFKDKKKLNAYNNIDLFFEQSLVSINTLDDFYRLTQNIISQIDIIYDNIQCKKGCARCCKFYSSPQIYELEWNYIKKHIETNLSEKQIQFIHQKFTQNINNLKSLLEKKFDMSKVNDSFYISIFYISECPFLIKNECLIYNVRPLICRIFGYSKEINRSVSESPQEFNQILTCTEEIERWKSEISQGNIKKVYLPYMKILEKKIHELTFKENVPLFYHSLDYWLTEYFNEY